MAAASGIAPDSSRLQRDANLSQLHSHESGCGGRIRTGDTRRMKPLPYHLATPLFIRKKLANGALALAGM
jgi:hypothetical protein